MGLSGVLFYYGTFYHGMLCCCMLYAMSWYAMVRCDDILWRLQSYAITECYEMPFYDLFSYGLHAMLYYDVPLHGMRYSML